MRTNIHLFLIYPYYRDIDADFVENHRIFLLEKCFLPLYNENMEIDDGGKAWK